MQDNDIDGSGGAASGSMTAPQTVADVPKVSDAAKAVCGAWFGMIKPGKGDVTFHLREWRPSDEAQAALNELVAAGVIGVEAFNRWGGLVYRPLIDCQWAFKWLGANQSNPAAKVRMVVDLASEKEGKAHQKAALRAAATSARQGETK